MTIKEALKPYRIDNFFYQVSLSSKLKRDMEKIAQDHIGWKYFNYLLTTGNTGVCRGTKMFGNAFHPDNIQALCDKLGFETIEQISIWVDSFRDSGLNVDNFIDVYDPEINIQSELTSLTGYEVIKIVKENCILEDNFNFGEILDGVYHPIPEKELYYILSQCPVDRYIYKAEGSDCDDFAFMTRSFMSENGLGNLLFSYVSVNCYDKDDVLRYAHALNLLMIEKEDRSLCFKFLEPQTDSIWDIKKNMLIGFSEYKTKIRFLII